MRHRRLVVYRVDLLVQPILNVVPSHGGRRISATLTSKIRYPSLRDSAQPATKRISILIVMELADATRDVTHDLLNHVGGVVRLQAGATTPGINDRPISGNQTVPGALVVSHGTPQQTAGRTVFITEGFIATGCHELDRKTS
jgi:hypothetical protein